MLGTCLVLKASIVDEDSILKPMSKKLSPEHNFFIPTRGVPKRIRYRKGPQKAPWRKDSVKSLFHPHFVSLDLRKNRRPPTRTLWGAFSVRFSHQFRILFDVVYECFIVVFCLIGYTSASISTKLTKHKKATKSTDVRPGILQYPRVRSEARWRVARRQVHNKNKNSL